MTSYWPTIGQLKNVYWPAVGNLVCVLAYYWSFVFYNIIFIGTVKNLCKTATGITDQ